MNQAIKYSESKDVPLEAILQLYRANNWSAANKPDQLHRGLMNSHTLITAWAGDALIGLANAISDGHLVVYYPHVCVDPDFHRQGIGGEMMSRLMARYDGFHQHSVLADQEAVAFFKRCGFEQSPCAGLWIYDGEDHD